MRLLRLPAAAGGRLRLQRCSCGPPPPPPPRLRLVVRRSSGVVDARPTEAAAAHPVAASGFCAACGVTHSLPRTPAAEAAAAELLSRVRAAGRFDFDAPVPVRRAAALLRRRKRGPDAQRCYTRRHATGRALCGEHQVSERSAPARAGADAGRAACVRRRHAADACAQSLLRPGKRPIRMHAARLLCCFALSRCA